MRKQTGKDKPGTPTINEKPHLGNLLLERYRTRITTGFDALEKFELIDRLEKPVLNFIFYGSKRIILEVYDCLSRFPYAYVIKTKKGLDLWSLPERGSRNAYVYISRFPNLIKFIADHEREIPNDLWGLLHGYPLPEVHQFTYDWETWANGKGLLENRDIRGEIGLQLP